MRRVPGKHDCGATGMSAGNPYAEFNAECDAYGNHDFIAES